MSHTDDFICYLAPELPDHIATLSKDFLRASLVGLGIRSAVLLVDPIRPKNELATKMVHSGKTFDFMIIDDPLDGITERLAQVRADAVLLNHPCKAPMDLIVTAGCTTNDIPFFDAKQVKKYGRLPIQKFIDRGNRKKRFS